MSGTAGIRLFARRPAAAGNVGVRPIGRPVWLLGPGVLWLLLFGVAPLAFMLMMSFWTSTIFGTKPDFSFENYARVLVTELYRDQLFKTLRIAVMTTGMALVIYRDRLSGRWALQRVYD